MVYRTLIDLKTLERHLEDEDWTIIDARFYLAEPERGERDYLDAHIEGAVYAHLDRDLSGAKTGSNGRHPLPKVADLARRFSSWGIDDTVQVVAYDTAGGAFAARVWWLLRYLGHEAVAVLDAGEGLGERTRSGNETRPARVFSAREQATMRVDAPFLEAKRDTCVVLDARAPERFRGDNEPLDPVGGHIPGALNHPFTDNLRTGGGFHDASTLADHFERSLSGRPAVDVVCYCGSGVTACHNLLAMETAGLKGARLYPGSWSEWCADPERPIATGDPVES